MEKKTVQKYYRFAKQYHLTSYILRLCDVIRPKRLTSLKYPIYCRFISNHWVCDDYEKNIREAFIKVVRERRCVNFYDVGANTGIFSLDFLTHVSKGKVIAFEPNPSVFKCLQKTKKKNNLENLLPQRLALSSYNGIATLTFDPMSPALGGLHPLSDGKYLHEIIYKGISKKCEVTSCTLDKFFSESKVRPDIIKIDAEGEEFQILKGSLQLLKENQPVLLFESSNHQDDTQRLLDDLGYAIYDLNLKPGPIGGMNFAMPK